MPPQSSKAAPGSNGGLGIESRAPRLERFARKMETEPCGKAFVELRDFRPMPQQGVVEARLGLREQVQPCPSPIHRKREPRLTLGHHHVDPLTTLSQRSEVSHLVPVKTHFRGGEYLRPVCDALQSDKVDQVFLELAGRVDILSA